VYIRCLRNYSLWSALLAAAFLPSLNSSAAIAGFLLQEAGPSPPSAVTGKQPRVREKAGRHPVERGHAAFYSQSLEGHKTACGGTYSPSELTAAHRSLPCGSKIRVTNLKNGKSVRVTVNDRGPGAGDRIVDLSFAAAEALDFVKQGTTLVKVEVLR
jgi:peptidoglycan lytic transglycosylase